VTFDLRHTTNVYGQYSEGSRAATSIELGCADPAEPCKLPNAMAGDPPLNQVVTRTVEAGVRGSIAGLTWHAGLFRATNRDDILFVMAERTGFGYFRNFDGTRRRGVELSVNGANPRLAWGAGYTWLRATFASEETVNGESNSSNDAAVDGEPGLEGSIDIAAGDRMPLVPEHLFKAFAELAITPRLAVDVSLLGSGKAYVRGNENNRHQPDGTYYLGEGTVDGYAIVDAGVRFALTERITLTGQITNVFDREYATAGQLGPAGFTETGEFVARPLPVADGEFPLRHTTFLGAGAPRRARFALRVRF
jgi:outer membrane receptor protein involved in Fe transport